MGEKMAEISNKTLAILMVGAIIVSLTGTLISINRVSKVSPYIPLGQQRQITGLALQDTGNVTVNIQGQTSLAVRRGIDFGSITPNGTLNISSDYTLIGRGGTYDCSVVANCSGLELENDGNTALNVTMNSSSNATDLIGGTAPIWSFYVASGNGSNTGNATRPDGGCTNIPPMYNSNAWTTFQKNTNYIICNGTGSAGLWFNDTNDTITIEFNLTIPGDATTGAKVAYIGFYNDP
jgi:hypothetical protein